MLYTHVFRTNFLTKPKRNYIEKRRLYEKFVRIMLMKLTPGICAVRQMPFDRH
jgi:hypothetical protein